MKMDIIKILHEYTNEKINWCFNRKMDKELELNINKEEI